MDPFDAREKELTVLLSEKEYADRQTTSYLELLIRVHGVVFSAAVVGAGWIFAQQGGGLSSGPIRCATALVLAFLICFATFQGVANYGIVLGYIRYKSEVLGPRIQSLLKAETNPLGAFRAIASFGSNRVVVISSVASGGLLLSGALVLIGYAGVSCARDGLGAALAAGTFFCAVMWLAATLSALALLREMARLSLKARAGSAGVPANQAAGAGG
jgi:hypothetical protein